MALYWNPLGALGLFNALTAWTLAVVIFAARPERWQNRILALLLAVEGFYWAGGAGLVYLTTDPATAYAAQAVTEVVGPAFRILYLVFLGTLETPLVGPLRSRPVVALLLVASVASAAFAFARMDLFLAGVAPTAYSLWDGVAGPWKAPAGDLFLAALLFGLVAAIHAWRTSPRGSAQRSRAAAYSIAFGIRDAGSIFLSASTSFVVLSGFAQQFLYELTVFAYYMVLAYAILRHQLFGIELRIKWTIRRGTVAAAFVAVFFVASEAAQRVFEGVAGPVAGLAAAGLLVFALAPLQRLADRLANGAMPRVHDSEEYRTVRKRELYRAAVESALQDGIVTERERDVLATMAEGLGLGPVEARAIERDAAAARTGA